MNFKKDERLSLVDAKHTKVELTSLEKHKMTSSKIKFLSMILLYLANESSFNNDQTLQSNQTLKVKNMGFRKMMTSLG